MVPPHSPRASLLAALALAAACDDPDAVTAGAAITVEGAACRVTYEVAGQWEHGFTANVTVTNKGAAQASWSLAWDFPSGQQVTGLWNGTFTQSGARVTVQGASWNAGLPAGASASFGFNGSHTGANTLPATFLLGGVSCGTGGGGGGSGGGGSGGGGSGSGGGGTCTAPAWQAGRWYRTGDVVRYTDGKTYVAEHDNPGYDPVISTWFWDPTTCGPSTPPPPPPPPPSGGSGFAALVSAATFEAMFPDHSSFYGYADLVAATAAFPAFATTGDLATRKREVAAFLANIGHETGDLVHTEEIAKAPYCASSPGCPCAPGQWYYGRGPIQLSWNYNYCAAGQALGLPLQAQPNLVSTNATIAWKTGLWFWMTQSGAGWTTAHDGITSGQGFGETIRTINGALECNGGNPGQVASRVERYVRFCQMLGVDPGGKTGC
jgi:predicted chitinase